MTGSKRVFVDTSPLIYLAENNITYSKAVRKYLSEEYALKESSFFTSTITLAEFYVKPKKSNDIDLVNNFKGILSELGFFVADVTAQIAEQSAELRSQYFFLKALDSLQLATALHFKCDSFFSNDKAFRNVKQLDLILVDDLTN
jgi:predicted nucleic acid-binding protein